MSRRTAYKLTALAVVLGVVGFAWGRTAIESARQPTDFPDLWQWNLTRVPPQELPCVVRVVLRTRHYPLGGAAPTPIAVPLTWEVGSDRTLASDVLLEERPEDCRLTAQMLDLRQLGIAVHEGDGPLRLQGVFRLYGSQTKIAARLTGHSLRGRPVVHPGGWVDGERPLLSFSTAGATGHHEYTLLLSTNPDDE